MVWCGGVVVCWCVGVLVCGCVVVLVCGCVGVWLWYAPFRRHLVLVLLFGAEKYLYIWCQKTPLRARKRPFYWLETKVKRIAVFVDAGYFWVQVSSLIAGSYTSRTQVQLNFPALHASMLAEIQNQFPGVDLLRVYWYDGPGLAGKTAEHQAIDALDDFKLRLGTRNGVGQQKGVDGLIIADIISLTQQKSITHALVVSGDADITPGVIAAQSMGLRVHLLNVGAAAATSPYLQAEVDFKRSWDITEVQKFASPAPVLVPAPVAASATAATQIQGIAQKALVQIGEGPHSAIFSGLAAGIHALPREIDGALLAIGRDELGRVLTDVEKRDLRREFKAGLK